MVHVITATRHPSSELAGRTGSPSLSPRTAVAPAHSRLTLAARVSTALVIVLGFAAATGLAMPRLFHDPPAYAGNARGTALVMLFVAIPIVIAAMRTGTRGSVRAQLVWLGALCYLLYNSVIFAFAVSFNSLFLLYVAALSLALWSLVALLASMSVCELPACFDRQLPVRGIGAYLVAIAVAFALVWLKDVVPGLITNSAPAALRGTGLLTSPIHVMDLGFTLPLTALSGIWLWRRRPWGYLVAGVMLVMLSIEGVSVATDQLFGHMADPLQPFATVPLFIVLTLLGLVPTILYFRHLREERAE